MDRATETTSPVRSLKPGMKKGEWVMTLDAAITYKGAIINILQTNGVCRPVRVEARQPWTEGKTGDEKKDK